MAESAFVNAVKETEGQQLRDAGHDQVLAGAETWDRDKWCARCRVEIRKQADSGRAFTADDIVAMVGLPDGIPGSTHNNAVGAVMRRMALDRIVKPTGEYRRSRRAHSRGRMMRVWVGSQHPIP